jgi:hypothetical protein
MPNPASRSSGYELVQQNWQYPQYRQSGCIGTSEIPVWCETPDQVEETIEAMIAESEIQPADRARCVFWSGLRLRQVRTRRCLIGSRILKRIPEGYHMLAQQLVGLVASALRKIATPDRRIDAAASALPPLKGRR